jgi:hypothetical protein
LTVTANGDVKSGGPGETLRYATAQGTHTVRNDGEASARAMMVCIL